MMTILFAAIVAIESDASRFQDAVLGGAWFAQEKKAEPKAAPAIPGKRTKRTLDELKGLLDHNIFSPPKAKKDPRPETKKEDKKDDPPKVRMLSVTGFVLNEVDSRYEALIEDREWSEKDKKYTVKEIKFYKAGDAMAGGTITEITVTHMIHVIKDTPRTLSAGDQIAADGSTSGVSPSHVGGGATASPTPAPTAAPEVPVDDKEKEAAAKRRREQFKKSPTPDEVPDEEPVVKKRKRD